jgi:hypothetical protein
MGAEGARQPNTAVYRPGQITADTGGDPNARVKCLELSRAVFERFARRRCAKLAPPLRFLRGAAG